MKAKNLLFSAIVLSSLVTTNLTVLAEEVGTNNSVETTVSTQADDVTEQPTENVEQTESITNPLTNGEELTHTSSGFITI